MACIAFLLNQAEYLRVSGQKISGYHLKFTPVFERICFPEKDMFEFSKH